MIDAEQTLHADPGVSGGQKDADVSTTSSSGSSSSDASKQDELAILERATGRKFSDVTQAEQFLRNLNNLVGDNAVAKARQKAEFADALVTQYAAEKGMSYEDAQQELQGLVAPSKARRPVSPSADKPVEDPRYEALEREMFLMKTPEASPYIDKVSRYAKAGSLSLSDAYKELYGDIVATKTKEDQLEAKRKDKKLASLSTSTSAPAAPSIPRSKELLAQYRKTGDQSLLQEAMKARSRETYKVGDEE